MPPGRRPVPPPPPRLPTSGVARHAPRPTPTCGCVIVGSWREPGGVVRVGEEAEVRAAHRLVSGGMAGSSQNTWPSLRFDAKAVNRLAGRFLPAGFYYKTFMRPRFLWPAYESVLSRFVNGGRGAPPTPPVPPPQRFAPPDGVGAGGGPARRGPARGGARAVG